MCGGDLDISEGMTVAECEYCGAKQTVPRAMDENLQNLFNRATTLRVKCEFDKAEKLYEKIIQADGTQSEAYWGLILCKYGIEYVDDPDTYKRVPTCHRASYDSIIADDDYKLALEHADIAQRTVYEEQAKEIDRIQREILALAQKEESYDVFICYKETDPNGQRTQDSVIANDIYYQLKNAGFKVFYAAITLEGKLGSAYEPIIFAALNSAKVMLAIGTKPEYFNAVWVKNEWSRFLKVIKKDRSKLLIPCYRDMDAYELPEEFAHLQAQDMSKIGFINDVVRGIEKVIKKDEPKPVVEKITVTQTPAAANVAPLLKRVQIFLADGDWRSANEYCEKVLDQDPENGEAYLGKTMADLKVKKKEELSKCLYPFDSNVNYKKVMQYGSEALVEELKSYNNAIRDRKKQQALAAAMRAAEAASTYAEYSKAATMLRDIKDNPEAAQKAAECVAKAKEIAQREREEAERKAAEAAREAAERARIQAEKMERAKRISGFYFALIPAIILSLVMGIVVLVMPFEYYYEDYSATLIWIRILLVTAPCVGLLYLFDRQLKRMKDNAETMPKWFKGGVITFYIFFGLGEVLSALFLLVTYPVTGYNLCLGPVSMAFVILLSFVNIEMLAIYGMRLYKKKKNYVLLRCGTGVIGVAVAALAIFLFFVSPIKFTQLSDGTYAYNGTRMLSSDYEVPTEYNGQPVTAIGSHAFSGTDGLTSVTIPASIKHIYDGAFGGCNNLLSVTFAENSQLTTIGASAFLGCNNLTTMEIPASVTTIGEFAFMDCENLLSVTFAENAQLKTIGGRAFSGCKALEKITFPDGVTEIGQYAFNECKGLKDLKVPDSVVSIGERAFSGCEKLESVTIPFVGSDVNGTLSSEFYYVFGYASSSLKTVVVTGGTSIGDKAFSNSEYLSSHSLTTIILPDTLTSIGGSAFKNCDKLTSLTIPEGVTSIGASAFKDCSKLTSITLPAGLTSIEEGAFYNCDALTSITIPASVTTIEMNAFYDCDNLVSVTFAENSQLTTIGTYAFKYCSKLASITLPAGLTSIEEYTFYECDALTSITIPASVTTIGKYAFDSCDDLASVSFAENSQLTSIEEGTFYKCGALTSITIPASVTTIGKYAFYDCDKLMSVSFAENSQLTTIGTYAFKYCSKLASITIPAGVTTIETYAFESCSNLSSVTFVQTNGWARNSSYSFSSSDLANTATAAKYLRSNYYYYTWTRS